VHWLSAENGLAFGAHGVAMEEGAGRNDAAADGSVTVELWVQPGSVDQSASLLTFFEPSTENVVAMRQDLTDLEICTNGCSRRSKAKILAEDVFANNRACFLTVASGESGMTIYADGREIKHVAGFHLHPGTAQIVLGTSPMTHDVWEGRYLGLSVYGRVLDAREVRSDYEAADRGGDAGSDALLAKYSFDERAGNIIHDTSGFARHLMIPSRYTLLAPKKLELPTSAYQPTLSYSADVAINILGFSPMGAVLYGYLSSSNLRLYNAGILSVLLSAGLSLAIELTQILLPTRSSDLTDVLNNTLGAGIGVMVAAFGLSIFERWFAETK
jgi:VanZ family protein